MGCDIHMFAEIREKEKWEKAEAVFDSCYSGEQKTDQPYDGRNYKLFAFLAGVRNRFDINPICDPKGYPKDLSPSLVEQLVDDWDSDGHSASWFTLKELKEADWSQKFTQGGVVPAQVYEYLKEINEPPKTYSQGISGNGIQTVSEQEWEVMDWQKKNDGTRWYVHMFWETTVADNCEHFITKTIPALEKLGAPEDVRIVFCFDN